MAFCQPSLSPGRQQQAVVGRDPLHLLGGIDQQAQVHSGFYMYLNLVVLTTKRREGKYWFKSGCPTPDPRWPAVQQLMVILVKLSYTLKMDLCQTYNNWNLIEAGPIPGDCDYSELRTAFLSHGQTCHLFIQNNQVKYQFYFDFVLETLFQAWLERNQEKFGSRQVFAESRQLCSLFLSSGQVWIRGVHGSRDCGASLQAGQCRGASSFWGTHPGRMFLDIVFFQP